MNSQQIQEEYQLQYYGFTSNDFITKFRDLILRKIKEAIDELEETISLKCPKELMSTEKFKGLYDEYEKETVKYLKSVEDELKSYFAIPNHVLLPEDEANVPCPKSDLETLDKEVKELEEMYMKERAFNYLCKKELEILDSLEALNNNIQCCLEKTKQLMDVKEFTSIKELLKTHQELLIKLSAFDNKSRYVCKEN